MSLKSVAILYSNMVTRYLTEHTLNSDYRVVPFDSVDALKAGCDGLDLVVCEVCDYGLDARKLFHEISDKYPVLFVSTRQKETERRKLLLQEKHTYLSMPYSPQDLLYAVRLSV